MVNAVQQVCPPNIGPQSRLFRLLIGAGALLVAVLLSDPIIRFVMAFGGVVAITEAVLSHCFVLAAMGQKDWR